MKQRKASLPLPAPELSIYRGNCIALLRRYFCMSVEIGRLPAVLGRECFSTRAEDYHVHSFEDTVLFVIDIERCLDRLAPMQRKLIAYIVLQEYTREETAALLGCTRMTIYNHFDDAVDAMSALLLRYELMRARPRRRRRAAATPALEASAPGMTTGTGSDVSGPHEFAHVVPGLLVAENLSSPPVGAN
jgi:sigma-70-like protein